VLLVPVDCGAAPLPADAPAQTPVVGSEQPVGSQLAVKSQSADAFERMLAAEEAQLASATGLPAAPGRSSTGKPGPKKGFGKGIASSTWTAAPYVAEVLDEDAPEWARRMRVESSAAVAQGADPQQGVVLVLGTDGAVAQRRLGTPAWRQFLIELKPARFDAQERRRVVKTAKK